MAPLFEIRVFLNSDFDIPISRSCAYRWILTPLNFIGTFTPHRSTFKTGSSRSMETTIMRLWSMASLKSIQTALEVNVPSSRLVVKYVLNSLSQIRCGRSMKDENRLVCSFSYLATIHISSFLWFEQQEFSIFDNSPIFAFTYFPYFAFIFPICWPFHFFCTFLL